MGSSVLGFHLAMNSYSLVIVALLRLSKVKGQCQSPSNAMCYDATAGALISSCCSGSQCQPYIPSGTTPTGAVDWYCQYLNKLALGESCANKVGTCDTNLNCIDGLCSDQATTTTTASSDTTTESSDTTTVSSDTTIANSDTSTATSPDGTTTVSSDTASATADTTTASIDCAAGGDICEYTSQYTNITKDCCSPYSCTSATSSSSICTGDNLPEGTTCFTNTTGSLGTCASGLSCVTTTCVADDPTCIEPVNGLCHVNDGSISQSIGSCCDGAYCLAVDSYAPSNPNKYCQLFSIEEGGNCNPDEYRGFCKRGLYCVDNICTSGDATTTTTTTTSTTTASTTTTAACVDSGTVCDDGNGTTETCCAPSECGDLDFSNGYPEVKCT